MNSTDDSAEEPAGMDVGGFEPAYLFRGDSGLRAGPIGRALGEDADNADIQNCADHVLRKESRRSSRTLESGGAIRILDPDRVYNELVVLGGKLARQAADVRAAMRRNKEVLIEGRIPHAIIEQLN